MPALGLILAPLACSTGEGESLALRLQLVRTTDCAQGTTSRQGLAQDTYQLRFSFIIRDVDESSAPRDGRQLLCDILVAPGQQSLSLQVPRPPEGRRLALSVEAFETGTEAELAFFGTSGEFGPAQPEVAVNLRPARQPSCAGTMKVPRAFHSATLLPDGRVLLVGGLVGSSDQAPEISVSTTELHATASIELFDPSTMQSTELASLPRRRAFHQAVLLPPSPGDPIRVLLVGGLEPGTPGAPVARPRASGVAAGLPFVVSPHETVSAAQAGILSLDLSEADQPTTTYLPQADLPRALFPQIAASSDGTRLLLVGGATQYQASARAAEGLAEPPAPVAYWLNISANLVTVAQTTPLERVRAGHTLLRLGQRFVSVGGIMDGPTGSETSQFAVALEPNLQPAVASPSPPVAPLAWASGATIGPTDGELANDPGSATLGLLVGGFAQSPGTTDRYRFTVDPPGAGAQVFRYANTRLAKVGDLQLSTSGYAQALRLHDGRVLVTGGNDPGGSSPLSADAQLSIVALDRSSSPPSPTIALQRGRENASEDCRDQPEQDFCQAERFGHRMTRLLDNAVLLSGGIGPGSTAVPTVLAHNSILSFRTGDASEDHPFARGPAAVASECLRYGGN